MNPTERGTRIQYIDGLRAVAVLSVVFYHAAGRQAGNWPYWLHWAALQGGHGVDLFFVLSGFCLSYPTLAARTLGQPLKFSVDRFLAKRFVRIIPPYYASIALSLCAMVVLKFVNAPIPQTMATVHNVTDALPQFLFLDKFPMSNGSYWSLAAEFRWYFLFPLLLLTWCYSVRAFGAIAVAAVALYAFTRNGAFDFLLLPSFMLGIVAAQIACMRAPLARFAPLVVLLMAVAALVARPNAALEFSNSYWVGWPLAAFFLVVSIDAWPRLAKAFAWRPLALVGLASYSIYLVHEPVVAILEENLGVNWPAAALASLAIGFAFWYAVERVIETPSVKRTYVGKLAPLTSSALRFLGLPTSFSIAAQLEEPQAPLPARVQYEVSSAP